MRLVAIAAVTTALLLASCGGSAGTDAAAYTEGFCAAFESWWSATRGDDLQEAMTSALGSGDYEEAKSLYVGYTEDVRDAAVALRDDLRALGTPDFDDGSEVAMTMNEVGDELVTYWTTAAADAESGISTASATRFVQTLEEFANSLDDQEHLKPAFESVSKGEFKEAFEQSDRCQAMSREADLAING